MGEGVDGASLERRQRGWEGHAITLRGLLEEQELGIELQDLWVIEVDVWIGVSD